MNKVALQFLESSRRTVRAVIPDSLHTRLANLKNDLLCSRRLGWSETRRLRSLFCENRSPDGTRAQFKPSNLLHPISIRSGTSDANELYYSVLTEAYAPFLPAEPVKLIVDAGANIGDTASWYLSRFPSATVIALEPDPQNFGMLQRNCSPYGGRAVLMNKGLWPRDTHLRVLPGERSSDIRVVEVSNGSPYDCEGLSFATVLANYAGPIDIFKCDIEGCELQLFSEDADSWLSRMRQIYIEIHGERARKAVVAATQKHGFTMRTYRDLFVFSRD